MQIKSSPKKRIKESAALHLFPLVTGLSHQSCSDVSQWEIQVEIIELIMVKFHFVTETGTREYTPLKLLEAPVLFKLQVKISSEKG